jgi:hypothetical protein
MALRQVFGKLNVDDALIGFSDFLCGRRIIHGPQLWPDHAQQIFQSVAWDYMDAADLLDERQSPASVGIVNRLRGWKSQKLRCRCD